jgi:hypothetical protein
MRSDSQVGPARARAATHRRMLRARTMAPTPRAARRNQHRMWSLGLRLDAHVVLIPRGGPGGGGGDGSYLCSTPSSSALHATAVSSARLCVPRGGGAPLGASMLRLNAAVVSNAAPTGTVHVARIPRRRPHVTQVNSRTRLYAIDVHRACNVRLYHVRIHNHKERRKAGPYF